MYLEGFQVIFNLFPQNLGVPKKLGLAVRGGRSESCIFFSYAFPKRTLV